MGKFSSNIRFLLLSEVNGGDLVLYKTMFLVAFGENWVSLFANLLYAVLNKELRTSVNMLRSKRAATWRPRKHLNSLPF